MRDLAWTCFSAPLVHIGQLAGAKGTISAYVPQFTHDRQRRLEQLDEDPTALLQHLSVRPTHRLGVYFEQLWHFFLQQDPETELIAHNLAVHDGGRTIGEFDCIVYDKQSRCHVHLELAVKFFLGVQQPATDKPIAGSALHWLGPDKKDRLATKLDQLLLRQIMLSDAPAAKSILHELGIADITRRIALKGYLFQPVRDPLPVPPGYNAACPLSCWVTLNQLQHHCATSGANTFAILPKRRWLSPAQCDTSAEKLHRHELNVAVAQKLGADDYPLLVAALDGSGKESSRFFVTQPDWPDRAWYRDFAQLQSRVKGQGER